MKFTEYPDRDLMMMDLADVIASDLRLALAQGERASLAVPGGTTPGPIFDVLAALDLEWERVDVLLTDERWVPETSERSNTRLIKSRLLTDRAASARFVPLYGATQLPEDSVATLCHGVRACLPLSVVLLGMGEDMHTASLFPGADQLELGLSANAPEIVAMRAPTAPEPRVTLSAPVLDGAMSKHLLITGEGKRKALEKAVALGDPLLAPVAAVLKNMTVHWAP